MIGRAVTALALVALVGCSDRAGSGGKTTVETNPTEPGCAPGEVSIGNPAVCTRVGPTAAPSGFVLAEDTAELAAIHPAEVCTGATRSAIGETSCIPVDDCGGTFPPAAASVVVRSGDSLADAIARAKKGALIAIDSGTYDGVVDLRSDVRLVGRCASKVTIRGPGPQSGPQPMGIAALKIGAKAKVELTSLTISGFDTAVAVLDGTAKIEHVVLSNVSNAVIADGASTVSIKESVLEGHAPGPNPIRGVVAMHASQVEVDDVDIRSMSCALEAMDPRTELHAKRSVLVSKGQNEDVFLAGFIDAELDIEESFISVERQTLLIAGRSTLESGERDRTSISIERSEIENGKRYEAQLMGVEGGAQLRLSESTVHADAPVVLGGFEAPSRTTVTNSSVFVTTGERKNGTAVTAIKGSAFTLESSLVSGARQTAVTVGDSSSRGSIHGCLITSTRAGQPGRDSGAGAWAVLATKGAQLEIADSTLSDNEQNSLTAFDEARLTVEHTSILDTRASRQGALGEGITIAGDASLTLHDSLVRGSADVALVLLHAQASIVDSKFEQNLFGVSVWETTVRDKGVPEANDREIVVIGTVFDNDPWLIEREMTFIAP